MIAKLFHILVWFLLFKNLYKIVSPNYLFFGQKTFHLT